MKPSRAQRKQAKAARQPRRTHILIHTWVTGSSKAGTCEDCDAMDGEQIEDGDAFDVENLDGDPWPPLHPNCVCEIASEWVPV